jgi:hypothetical protein
MKALALLVSLLFCVLVLRGRGQNGPHPHHRQQLLRNATNHLDDLALAGGHTLIHTPLVIGGSSFQVHADKAKAEGKARLYTNGRDLSRTSRRQVGLRHDPAGQHQEPRLRPPTSRMRASCAITSPSTLRRRSC